MNNFHAHIYFEPNCIENARICSVNANLAGIFDLVKLFEQPIGPHPTGMIETHFTERARASALAWLEANRGDFSVLIHPDTGNDIKDHTEGIQWLGGILPLNFDFFKLIQEKPELRIHPI